MNHTYWNPRNETLSRDELRALQHLKLKRLCEWAREKSVFHRRRWEAAGFHPDQLKSVDDIRRIPFMTREEWMEAQLEARLSAVHVRHGRLEDALARNEKTLPVLRRLFGEDDPRVAQMATNQSSILRRLGRLMEAEKVAREAAARAERTLGEHPTTANALLNLGPILRAQNRLDEAQAAYERAAAIYERTTGAELVRQLRGRPLDAFVAGVGTGGTLVGVGRALREVYPDIRLVAVEPTESAVMSGGAPGEHGISGIGDGFVPAIAGNGDGGLHRLIDEVVTVSTADAVATARELAERHGFCVGISSGANYLAAAAFAAQGQSVATVFADGFTKYRSRGLEHCEPGRCPYEHDLVVPIPD